MTKSTSKGAASRTVRGYTSDGVAVLAPKTTTLRFTTDQIRSTLSQVAATGAHDLQGNIFVERRPQGDFAVRRQGAERASAVLPTQREAIAHAKELEPGKRPLVERVRSQKSDVRGRWRRA